MAQPEIGGYRSLHVRPATPVDIGAMQGLLKASALSAHGVAQHLHNHLVGEVGSVLVAAAGVEACGHVGLLRSVVVRDDYRATGHGTTIATASLRRAEAQGVKDFYLLAATAFNFFVRLGFHVVPKSEAPDVIRAARDFSILCHDSTVLMRRVV